MYVLAVTEMPVLIRVTLEVALPSQNTLLWFSDLYEGWCETFVLQPVAFLPFSHHGARPAVIKHTQGQGGRRQVKKLCPADGLSQGRGASHGSCHPPGSSACPRDRRHVTHPHPTPRVLCAWLRRGNTLPGRRQAALGARGVPRAGARSVPRGGSPRAVPTQ